MTTIATTTTAGAEPSCEANAPETPGRFAVAPSLEGRSDIGRASASSSCSVTAALKTLGPARTPLDVVRIAGTAAHRPRHDDLEWRRGLLRHLHKITGRVAVFHPVREDERDEDKRDRKGAWDEQEVKRYEIA